MVQSGEIVYVTPELKTISDSPIFIISARTTCPCFELLSVPTQCDPGERVFFPIRVDTAQGIGGTTQTLFVSTNLDEYRTKIRGKALTDISSAPSTIYLDISQQKYSKKKVYLWSTSTNFNIIRSEYDTDLFTLDIIKEDPNKPENKEQNVLCSYEIVIGLKSPQNSNLDTKNKQRYFFI